MKTFSIALIAASDFALSAMPTQASAQPGSSLSQYKGFGHNEKADEAQFKREQQARKRAVAVCMRDAGFKYVPRPEVENPRRSRGPNLPETFNDPNAEYLSSLSETRQTEYNLTLYGVPDPNDQENLWDPTSETGGGCWGDAMRTFPGVYAARSALAKEYARMQQSALEQPEFKEAESTFATCMTDKGFRVDAESRTITVEEGVAGPGSDKGIMMRSLADCRKTARFDEVRGRVISQMESDFVKRHKATLDRHADKLASQPAVQ